MIDTENPGSVVVVEGLLDALADYRDRERWDVRADLRDTRRKLEELQAEMNDLVARRSLLVRRITAWGDGTDTDRKLSADAGVSHTSIRRIRHGE